MAAAAPREAFVTLATNDSYSLGALVLAHSLKISGTSRDIVCLITDEVTQGMREQLNKVFSEVVVVNVMDSGDDANLGLLARPELGVTFTKIHCWRLTQYQKCVFMDADCLVIQNVDDLFERDELSAAPDIGWPDCFNSGVFVFKPSQATYEGILSMALGDGSFDGGDQGLLNAFFGDWAVADIKKHLPFVYNMSASLAYTYKPAFKKYTHDVKVVHFLGTVKPWHHGYDTSTSQVQAHLGDHHSYQHLQLWWDFFIRCVQPNLNPSSEEEGIQMAISEGIASLNVTAPPQPPKDERQWQQSWEQGRIDYLGNDAFENIMQKLKDSMSK